MEALAEAGADTGIASRNIESLQQVAEEETKRGYKVNALQLIYLRMIQSKSYIMILFRKVENVMS